MTKEEYYAFSIRTLRIKGRKVGVKSPTTLSKEALIDQIMAVESGLVEPIPTEEQNRGRPPIERKITLINKETEPSEKTEIEASNCVENEPPKEIEEPCVEEEVIQSLKKDDNINNKKNQTQYNPRKYDYVLQRIRWIEDVLKEIFDYLIYEGL